MALVDTVTAGSFNSLKLSPFVSETLQSLGFSSMTPVQASVIPLFLNQHKDVVVQAVTGSGKTLAFVIPLLEKLARRETPLKDDQVGGIIICPTRELAIQTHKVVEMFVKTQAAAMDLEGSTSTQQTLRPPLLLIGGNSILREDIQAFKSLQSDVLIGTPGRLEEFLLGSSSLTPSGSKKKGKAAVAALPPRALKSVCNVKELEMLILDEADRVLELGYQLSINRILGVLPKQRRTGCFSATMSEGLGELCRVGLRNPVRIVVKVERKAAAKSAGGADQQERNTPASLQNTYIICKTRQKLARLLQLLQGEVQFEDEPKKFIVYFATCACVDYFYKLLSPLPQLAPFTLYSLHGQQTPSKRTSTYTSFLSPAASTKSPHQILLCTDVAARGLDLPSVDVVIQFDPPQDPKQFNHRAGRTARAGRKGKAVVLLCEGREEEYVEFLKRRGVPLRPEEGLLDLSEEQAGKQEQWNRKAILGDRDLSEKGTKAFVSFVRSYSKHEASYIFNLKEYDLLGLARCFGLLRLPKMPELKEVRKDGSWQDTEVNWEEYAYKDKIREKARLETLAKEKEDVPNGDAADLKRKKGLPKPTQAWSNKVDARDRRDLRKEKKVRKRAYLKSQDEQATAGGADGKQDGPASDEDFDDLSEDEPASKKVKKSKPGKDEFNFAFGGGD